MSDIAKVIADLERSADSKVLAGYNSDTEMTDEEIQYWLGFASACNKILVVLGNKS